ncbi:MAG: TIGR00289 family protein, partial [Nanoarchaeota archaeon]
WLGKRISIDNFKEFKEDSKRYGFHIGGEGGYYDTLVVDAPIFSRKILIGKTEKYMEDRYSGHIKVMDYKVVNKVVVK